MVVSLRRASIVLAPLWVGCSVGLMDDAAHQRTFNECETNAQCGAEGACQQGSCVATQGRLTSVLVEVNAPADAPEISGMRFLKHFAALPAGGGSLDIELGHIARVSGSVTAALAEYQLLRGCEIGFVDASGGHLGGPAEDGSIPARVTFTPIERFLGLSATSSTAESAQTADVFSFSAKLAPGDYHLYVQPQASSDPACALAPQIIRHQRIDPGDVKLPIALPPPERLELTIRWPDVGCTQGGCRTLEGWRVDMIDPVSGRVVSTRRILADEESSIVDGKRQYVVELIWSAPLGDDEMVGSELVRLSPPEDVAAPRILLERSGLELFTKGEAVIDRFETLPPVIEVEGQVVIVDSAKPVQATVTLVATELAGLAPGLFASFVRVAEADDQGHFSVQLLPGKYNVQAVPPSHTELAATEAQWSIADSPLRQAGKVVELRRAVTVSGSVFTPGSREALVGAAVQLEPATVSPGDGLLEKALGAAAFTPRSSSEVTDGGGQFAMLSDPGLFDFSVRPARETGFAWFVYPNMPVDSVSSAKEVRDIELPLPVSYSGTVRAPSTGTLPGALIRVFVYQDDAGYTGTPDLASSMIQVAETQVDPSGNYQLLIPSRL